MGDFVRVGKMVYNSQKSADIDYKVVGPTGKGYASVSAALEYLGQNGLRAIVSGLHFIVRNADGSTKEYRFTSDAGAYEEVGASGGDTSQIVSAINTLDERVDGHADSIAENILAINANVQEITNIKAQISNFGNIADSWVSSKSYYQGDIVSYGGKFWIAKKNVSANIAPAENEYWGEKSIGGAIADIKNGEANFIDAVQGADKVDISLCHDSESDEISTTSIPAASASGAGVMSVDDKQTLQILESNAPKNIVVNPKENEVELKMAVVRGTDKVVSIPSATSTSSGVMSKADKVALDGVIADVERMTGLGGSNYLGIFSTIGAATTAHVTYSGGADKTKVAAWALVGTDISSLTLYTAVNGGDLTAWSGKTYDFTDYQNVESKVEELSQKVNGDAPTIIEKTYNVESGSASSYNVDVDIPIDTKYTISVATTSFESYTLRRSTDGGANWNDTTKDVGTFTGTAASAYNKIGIYVAASKVNASGSVSLKIVIGEQTSKGLVGDIEDIQDDINDINDKIEGIGDDIEDVNDDINSVKLEIDGREGSDSNYASGRIDRTDGSIKSNSVLSYCTDYLEIVAGDTIEYLLGAHEYCYFVTYNSSKERIGSFSGSGDTAKSKTITSENAAYIRFSFVSANKGDVYVKINDVEWRPTDIITEYVGLKDRCTKLENKMENVGGSSNANHSACAYLLKDKIKTNRPYYFDDSITETSYVDSSYLDNIIRNVPKGKHFIFSTDSHIDYANNMLANKETEIMAYVKSKLNIPNVVFGGDCIGGQDSKFVAAKILSVFMEDKLNAFGGDFIFCVGNHDTNTASTTMTDELKETKLISDAEVYKRTTRQMQNYGKAVFDEEGIALVDELDSLNDADKAELKAWMNMHYYYDDEVQKIRYIVVECDDRGYSIRYIFKTDGGQYSNMTYIDFIADAMKNVPKGYDVVIVTHEIISTTEQPVEGVGWSSVDGYNNTFNNLLQKILIAYKNMQAISFVGHTKSDGSVDDVIFKARGNGEASRTYDFSNIKGTSRVFIVEGHFHVDDAFLMEIDASTSKAIGYEYDVANTTDADDKVLRLIFDRSCLTQSSAGSGIGKRPKGHTYSEKDSADRLGTTDEILFDVVTITDDDKVITTRFGAGGAARNREFVLV